MTRAGQSRGSNGQIDRILVIRMHAIGDVAITLPFCEFLRRQFPGARIDFLTTAKIALLPNALATFDEVISFPECATVLERIKGLARTIPLLRKNSYSFVLDLQTNWVSRTLRLLLFPDAWTEFDRVSPKSAAERVQESLRRSGLMNAEPVYGPALRDGMRERGLSLLRSKGFTEDTRLILLNPAGVFLTRNWPIESYVELARLMLQSGNFRFLLLGIDRMRKKADFLESALGKSAINLTCSTTLAEAMAILPHLSLAVSEDSGLMHMAWASGVPTIALFGSTRHDWSSPIGSHVRVFHSGDLPCGDCMSPTCKFGDVHCLTRITPQAVYDTAMELLEVGKHQ